MVAVFLNARNRYNNRPMDAAQFLDHLTHTDTCNLSRALLALARAGQLIDADAVDYFIHIPVWPFI